LGILNSKFNLKNEFDSCHIKLIDNLLKEFLKEISKLVFQGFAIIFYRQTNFLGDGSVLKNA
jgi:high-affinity nickel permease